MRPNHWSLQLLIIVLLPFVLFWRWIVQGEVLYWGTLLFQFWPWHQLVKTSLLAGEWPLWNPLLGNGTPLLANLQSAVFYPPNLLYLLMPVEHGLTLSIILHLSLAGMLMFLYARQIGLNSLAATLSALTYMFSGYLIGRTQFVTMINAAAWMPLLLLLCERLALLLPLKKSGGLDVLWLGLALAMPILAGHAQLWFYSLWLVGSYTIIRSWQTSKDKGQRRPWLAVLHAGLRFGIALGLACMLSAVQLLPTIEFMLQSERGGGAESGFALTYSFWPWRLVTLLAPTFFGHPAHGDYWGYANFWEDHAYVGILPLLLALVAIWHYLRGQFKPAAGEMKGGQFRGNHIPPAYRRVVPFFAGLVPVSLVLAMGWNTPVYSWVFDLIPGFGYFQAPARLLIWYTVSMAVLAGVGTEIFRLSSANHPLWRRLLAASLGVAIAALASSLMVSGRNGTFLIATFTLGIWLTLSLMLLLSRPDPEGSPAWRIALWPWALIILVVVDLLLAAFPLLPMLPAAIYTQRIASAEFIKGGYRYYIAERTDYTLKFNRYFRFDTFGPAEISYWKTFRESLAPNMGVYAGIPSLNNDDPLTVGHWAKLTALLEKVDAPQQTRLLGLANVGYVVNHTGEAKEPIIYEDGPVLIQRLLDPLPRAYFVTQAHLVKHESEAIARLTAADFDSRQEVVIMGGETGANPASVALVKPTDQGSSALSTIDTQPVTVTRQGSGELMLTVETPEPGLVVLTDTYYPGWQATVDGQTAPIWLANHTFRAVAVKAGSHQIKMSYEPASFRLGLWISGITLLIVILSGALLIRYRTRQINQNQETRTRS